MGKKLMYIVRIAQIDDIEKISLVHAASWKTAYRGIVGDDYLDSLKDDHWVSFLTTALGSGDIFAMVLQDDKEIIGASVLGRPENAGEIHMISFYLLPDKIGRGLGHKFFSGIEKEIRNRGYTKCIVDVLENNERAIKFYKAHGFSDMRADAETTLGKRNYTYKVFEKTL
jgi:ribosomal protein S18 acetylase RimI-like enzyme